MIRSQAKSRSNRTLTDGRAGRFTHWMRRIGLAGAAVFLVKGLLWLVIPALVARGLVRPSPKGTDAAPVAVED